MIRISASLAEIALLSISFPAWCFLIPVWDYLGLSESLKPCSRNRHRHTTCFRLFQTIPSVPPLPPATLTQNALLFAPRQLQQHGVGQQTSSTDRCQSESSPETFQENTNQRIPCEIEQIWTNGFSFYRFPYRFPYTVDFYSCLWLFHVVSLAVSNSSSKKGEAGDPRMQLSIPDQHRPPADAATRHDVSVASAWTGRCGD